MLRIGLTGGMGCGKSTIAHIFSALGIPVYDADSRAKILSSSDEIRQVIARNFGQEAANDRKILAGIVFRDSGRLARLNAIVHPPLLEDCRNWFDRISRQTEPPAYAIAEAAILFESDMDKLFDYVITVEAPEYDQIERCLQRDGCSREDILSRLSRQLPGEKRRAKADFVIENARNQAVLGKVLELDRELRLLALKN